MPAQKPPAITSKKFAQQYTQSCCTLVLSAFCCCHEDEQRRKCLQAAWHTSGMVPSSCWACLLVGAQVPIGRLPTGWLRRGREARLALKWRNRHAMTLPKVATCNKVHTSCPALATSLGESASEKACKAAATCCCM